ncbi:MAG: winged helix-turn-helix domain-containing protein [Gemmatimonadales bacterium]|nr:MAG: winged helix-turn-helix domain-containing protein [Gemmatimonadales bacterium]
MLVIPREQVVRLWLQRQGLLSPRSVRLTKRTLVAHLEGTGALQVDTINVVDRAHYLTLWSRFGSFEREKVDRWIYRERAAYEYWGHEASILPITHLPIGRRRMQRFPPASWSGNSWWSRYQTSPASKRRVLRRLREEGPLESADFEAQPGEFGPDGLPGRTIPLIKEDNRSLKLLWHAGRVAIRSRRHFRCQYDLASRVHPPGEVARKEEYEDSWLHLGLSCNGIASEKHLVNYFTAPNLDASERRRVIERNLRAGRITKVRVPGTSDSWYATPECLDRLSDIPDPEGTTLLCPFDSFLWQRRRAEDLLGFYYRIEIYVPAAKRRFGYYVLPILHEGRLVGRLDPKLHRDRGELEIKALLLEPGFKTTRPFHQRLEEVLQDLKLFLGAERLTMPAKR